MSFRIDAIAHPDSKVLADQYECSICMCIAERPVQTIPCEHIFCQDCLDPCSFCPVCRKPFEAGQERFKPLSSFQQRQLCTIKVWCPYHERSRHEDTPGASRGERSSEDSESASGEPAPKRTRFDSGRCTWEGSYDDLLKTHLDQCEFHLVPCPQGCNASVRRGAIEEHKRTCPWSLQTCSICQERVRRRDVERHLEQAARAHVRLLEVRCKDLEGQNRELRLLKDCGKLGGIPLQEICWTPHPKMPTLRELLPVDKCVSSEVFCRHFRLVLYPNGRSDSPPGTQPGAPVLSLRATAGEYVVDCIGTCGQEEEITASGLKVSPRIGAQWVLRSPPDARILFRLTRVVVCLGSAKV